MGGSPNGIARNVLTVIEHPEKHSLKRVAWAYGCSKKDSAEEQMLFDALWKKFEQLRKERDDGNV